MNNQTYDSDNEGNRMPNDPGTSNPIAGSGQQNTLTDAGTNYALIVVGGGTYHIVAGKAASSAIGEIISLSISGAATVAANKEWNFGIGGTGIVIKIPETVTSLKMVSTLANTIVYVSRLT